MGPARCPAVRHQRKALHKALTHYVSNPRNGGPHQQRWWRRQDGARRYPPHYRTTTITVGRKNNSRNFGWPHRHDHSRRPRRRALLARNPKTAADLAGFATKQTIPNQAPRPTCIIGRDTVAMLPHPIPHNRSPLALCISFEWHADLGLTNGVGA